MARSCVLVCDASLRSGKHEIVLWEHLLIKPFPEAYTLWEVHGEQRGMRYGVLLPRTSQVGNQVHQDDPVNEAVRDAFGVQENNFTSEEQGPEPVFFRNDAAREFFSLMDESDRPLYQGCQKYSKLSFRSNCTISSACVGSAIRQCREREEAEEETRKDSKVLSFKTSLTKIVYVV
ncbi:hypothetical protein K1719_030947 [Acacia pycnantha]|nr:hypothetical protein K1719_030947 [Acacia pycnantha]